jgi:hypothetical protein
LESIVKLFPEGGWLEIPISDNKASPMRLPGGNI